MQLALRMNRWGGARARAGRPKGKRVPHARRPAHKNRFPVSLTLRVCRGLPSLRRKDLFGAIKDAIARASREDFQVVCFSVQGNHLHLIVEAHDDRLAPGARGLCVRIAHRVNRQLGRSGQFFDERYHARTLTSPREVRSAYVYVLMNAKKHHPGQVPDLDPFSSAPWFDGFRTPVPRPPDPPPVRPPGTWLATVGWLRHGRIHPTEAPAPN